MHVPSPFNILSQTHYQPKPTLDDNEEEVYEILKFVGHRTVKNTSRLKQLKVRWLGYDSSFDSWENVASLLKSTAKEIVLSYAQRHKLKVSS